MPTIISKPATPTFIVSTTVVDLPDKVTSVFGRTGDVLATDGDYGIKEIGLIGALEIGPLSFHEGEIIVVENNKFELKLPETGEQAYLVSDVLDNDIFISDGGNWKNVPFSTAFNTVLDLNLFNVQAGEFLNFNGSKWINFDLLALMGTTIDNSIASITHPAAPVTSVFGRAGIVIAVTGDYAISQITGLTDTGPGTKFLADDGAYKTITHPPGAVTSVFGRIGIIIAASGDYSIAQITGLATAGPGTNFLADDGVYKTTPPAPVASVFGRTGAVVAANNDYALPQIDGLIDSGAGTKFLADDGAYKTPAGRQVVASSVADSTTIVNAAAHTTIFDFAPDAVYRNNNCLITIHYQAHNVFGPAQLAVWLQSSAGLTVQQNAYNGGVAQDSNGDERFAFTVVMEGIVSASGNIQIGVRADLRDHDFSNNASNGKTRLTIELV